MNRQLKKNRKLGRFEASTYYNRKYCPLPQPRNLVEESRKKTENDKKSYWPCDIIKEIWKCLDEYEE